MVGIVVVSHSARLAEGVVELAREMAGDDVPIAAAGGLDEPGEPLGTDAVRVMAALQEVPEGAVAAAAAARAGAGLDEAAAEAARGLAGKEAHLGADAGGGEGAAPEDDGG